MKDIQNEKYRMIIQNEKWDINYKIQKCKDRNIKIIVI